MLQEVKSVKLRKVHHIATAVMLILLAAQPGLAATSCQIRVSATILPYVSFNAAQHVMTYQVTSEDLKKGYVDLPNAITVNVRTNVNSGVPVIIDNWGNGKVLVKESGSASFSESSFTLNIAGYRLNSVITKNYDSRIILPADAQEGVYPFSISMTPAI